MAQDKSTAKKRTKKPAKKPEPNHAAKGNRRKRSLFEMTPAEVAGVDPLNLRPYKSFVEDRPWLRDDTQYNKKFDAEAQLVFLDAYARTGRVSDAAVAANITEVTVYQYVKYDQVFSTKFNIAKLSYRDLVVSQVQRRGIEGVLKPKWGKDDTVIGHERVYSDRLLELEAKRVEPGYRESATQVTVNTNPSSSAGSIAKPDLSKLSMKQLENLMVMIPLMKAAQSEDAKSDKQGETEMKNVTPPLTNSDF